MLDDGGRTAPRGGLGAGGEVLPLGMARIHHVNVIIDHSRDDVQSFGVDDGLRLAVQLRSHCQDLTVFDQNVALVRSQRVDHLRVLDNEIGLHGVDLRINQGFGQGSFCRTTPLL